MRALSYCARAMNRLVIVVLLSAACDSVDDRPATLQYITPAILEPSCAKAECHSSFKMEVGDDYSSVEAARNTMIENAQVLFPDNTKFGDNSPSFLVTELTTGNPSILDPTSTTKIRMPYDEPLPLEDIELIKRWIEDGASGAQCTPGDNDLGCYGPGAAGVVISCDPDGNIPGAPFPSCTTATCASGQCEDGLCLPVQKMCGQGSACFQGQCVAVNQ